MTTKEQQREREFDNWFSNKSLADNIFHIVWLFSSVLQIVNGISTPVDTQVCPMALPEGGRLVHTKFLNSTTLLAVCALPQCMLFFHPNLDHGSNVLRHQFANDTRPQTMPPWFFSPYPSPRSGLTLPPIANRPPRLHPPSFSAKTSLPVPTS
jgi:hypothetical protein